MNDPMSEQVFNAGFVARPRNGTATGFASVPPSNLCRVKSSFPILHFIFIAANRQFN